MKQMPRKESGDNAPRCLAKNVDQKGRANEEPSIFLMCAYFLGLASIVVVFIGGHFPWFTLAPLAVLLMASHIRRVEAKFQRESSRIATAKSS